MLDRLLEYGRHLPLLAEVLSWAPVVNWLLLRRLRRGFPEALGEEQLQRLAAGRAALAKIDGGTFASAVDSVLMLRQFCARSRRKRNKKCTTMERAWR